MSSEKTENGFKFECDGEHCGEILHPESLGRGSASRDFMESLEDAKAQGWVARQGRGGVWQHFCPDCK